MQDPEQITFFAKTDARGQQVPFGVKANDRTRHVYVIGKTGMGKSTLLENMAVQDIKNGNGLAFIDPHGQTAETLLDYIPEDRKKDVVYFAPFDTDNPISFNVMEDVGEDKRHLVVSGLMSVFKKIWVDAWSARMEYILSNTLLALLEYPDSTLLGVNRMLSDKDYRMRVIENITDPAVKSFWVDEFLKYNERYMQEAGDAIKNKIGQFTSNPLIRNIIGQSHSSFDIREIMDNKKILIMNLSKGLVGDQNANLLGSMLTTRIYLAAMSRANLSAEQMKLAPNFYFYVDEFQSFANATFADILSEARKYKLNLTIAHQYIQQMEEEVRDAVFGNVGTIISFRVGPFDAEVLETVFTPKFLAPDIVNLGFAQIYLTLMIDGIGSQPFSASTLPPIALSGVSCKDMVIAESQKQFSQKRPEVEETIHAWHAKSFSNKPPYIPKHLREAADGGELPNTGENLKKHGPTGSPKTENKTGADNKSGPTTGDKKSGPGDRTSNYKGTNPRTTGSTNNYKKDFNSDSDKNKNSRPSDRNDSYKKSTPSPSTGSQNKPYDGQKKEKNLDDLRSVLKGMSGPDSDNNNIQNKPKETKRDEAGFKTAVATALSGVTTEGEEKKVIEKEPSKLLPEKKTEKQENQNTHTEKSNREEKKVTEDRTVSEKKVEEFKKQDARTEKREKNDKEKVDEVDITTKNTQEQNSNTAPTNTPVENVSSNIPPEKKEYERSEEKPIVEKPAPEKPQPVSEKGTNGHRTQENRQQPSIQRSEVHKKIQSPDDLRKKMRDQVPKTNDTKKTQSQYGTKKSEGQQSTKNRDALASALAAASVGTTKSEDTNSSADNNRGKAENEHKKNYSRDTKTSHKIKNEYPPKKNPDIQDTSTQPSSFSEQKNINHAHSTTSFAPKAVVAASVTTNLTVDAQSYAQMKNIDDPLSPKKLERMMRTTTADKLPLK